MEIKFIPWWGEGVLERSVNFEVWWLEGHSKWGRTNSWVMVVEGFKESLWRKKWGEMVEWVLLMGLKQGFGWMIEWIDKINTKRGVKDKVKTNW